MGDQLIKKGCWSQSSKCFRAQDRQAVGFYFGVGLKVV